MSRRPCLSGGMGYAAALAMATAVLLASTAVALISMTSCRTSERALAPVPGFVLTSPEVADGGMLPRDYTGDGSAATLPLAWEGAPEGTASYALIMHHIPPQGPAKWYWVLYGIPADVHRLPRNVQGIGTLGSNSVNRQPGYAPPHSKGPGPKIYVYTLYALSAPPRIPVPPAEVGREVLLTAMQDLILATAQLQVVYTRPPGATSPPGARGAGPPPSGRAGSEAVEAAGAEGPR